MGLRVKVVRNGMGSVLMLYCDNVRLCLVQDQCRAHAMLISNWRQRETQQNSSYIYFSLTQTVKYHSFRLTTSQASQILHITGVTEAGACYHENKLYLTGRTQSDAY